MRRVRLKVGNILKRTGCSCEFQGAPSEFTVVSRRHRLFLKFGVFFYCIFVTGNLPAHEKLQVVLKSLMRGRRGAVIVSNPMTGELLAVWSPRTGFNQAFPPGSTAKLVEATALLEEQKITVSDGIVCRRVPELLGEAYHCSHRFLALPFDLSTALANSCNYFFAALSVRLSASHLAHWYSVFGFGNPAGMEGSQATGGRVNIVDSPESKARAALGEGALLATPAQVLLAYSAIAARGKVFRFCPENRDQRPSPRLLRRLEFRPETFDALNTGLEECVRSGTGQAAAVPGVRVAGKTGTATALDGSRATYAWFVGYAPAVRPEIALVVFLERGTGAHDAAPLAGRVLIHYFALKNRRR